MKKWIALGIICLTWAAGFGSGHFVMRKSMQGHEHLYDLVSPDLEKDKLFVINRGIGRHECDAQREFYGAGHFCVSIQYPEDQP